MIRVRRRRRPGIDVADSGALSDIAFLLIIFFIVIAVFNVNSGFLLQLPQRNSVTMVQVDDLVRVAIRADNTLSMDGTIVTRDEFSAAVRARRQRQPNMTLVVRIHPEAAYQSLVSMVEVARLNDVDNFSFTMEGE